MFKYGDTKQQETRCNHVSITGSSPAQAGCHQVTIQPGGSVAGALYGTPRGANSARTEITDNSAVGRSTSRCKLRRMLLNNSAAETKSKPIIHLWTWIKDYRTSPTLGLTILSYLPNCGLTSQLIIPWCQGCCTTGAFKVKLNLWTSRCVWCSAGIYLRTVISFEEDGSTNQQNFRINSSIIILTF